MESDEPGVPDLPRAAETAPRVYLVVENGQSGVLGHERDPQVGTPAIARERHPDIYVGQRCFRLAPLLRLRCRLGRRRWRTCRRSLGTLLGRRFLNWFLHCCSDRLRRFQAAVAGGDRDRRVACRNRSERESGARYADAYDARIAGLCRVRQRVIVRILEIESDFHFARVPAGSQRLRGNVANGLRGTGSGGVIVISGARSTMSGSDSPFADDPPPPQHTGPTA